MARIILIFSATRCSLGIVYQQALLYRIGLHSNAASPLALFLRIEPLYFCSCIRKQTCVATNTATAEQIMK